MLHPIHVLRGVSGEILQKRCYIRQGGGGAHLQVTKNEILPDDAPAPSDSPLPMRRSSSTTVLYSTGGTSAGNKNLYYEMLRLILLLRGVMGVGKSTTSVLYSTGEASPGNNKFNITKCFACSFFFAVYGVEISTTTAL